MVTENGHGPIGLVVGHDLVLGRRELLHVLGLGQLILQRLASVVRTEHFCGQPGMIDDRCLLSSVGVIRSNTCSFFDLPLQNCVRLAWTRGPLLSTFWKSMDCLKRIEILAEELEVHVFATAVEGEVLHAQRAATDRVRFIFILLATDAQRQDVDEPHRRRLLLELAIARVEVPLIIPPNFIDTALELHRLVELVEVALALERRVRREHHIFILGHDVLRALATVALCAATRGVDEDAIDASVSSRRWRGLASRRVDAIAAAPLECIYTSRTPPPRQVANQVTLSSCWTSDHDLPGSWQHRRRAIPPHVDRDAIRLRALLDHSRSWMFTSTAKQRGRLHPKIADLLDVAIEQRKAALE